jgi:hypothetical protein
LTAGWRWHTALQGSKNEQGKKGYWSSAGQGASGTLALLYLSSSCPTAGSKPTTAIATWNAVRIQH